jgi:hypothetical protein
MTDAVVSNPQQWLDSFIQIAGIYVTNSAFGDADITQHRLF